MVSLLVAYNRFDTLKEESALLHGQGIGSVAAAETLRDLFHPVIQKFGYTAAHRFLSFLKLFANNA